MFLPVRRRRATNEHRPGFLAAQWSTVDAKGHLLPLPIPLKADGSGADKARMTILHREFVDCYGVAVW